MTFLPKALYLTDAQIADKILATKFSDWKPSFSVVHNTGVPNLKQGEAWGESARTAWGDNLNHYYKSLGWHSGPFSVPSNFVILPKTEFIVPAGITFLGVLKHLVTSVQAVMIHLRVMVQSPLRLQSTFWPLCTCA